VVYGRHFDATAAPAWVGAKLLKRNLSDVAAMGGRPGPALVNLLLGPDVSLAWIEEFHRGLAQSCQEFGVSILGGDLAQGPVGVFAAHLTLLGLPGDTVLRRDGARAGDALYVTGELGGSILGKHLSFMPRLAEGQWLARQGVTHGVIDVTDGLAKDLPAILPAGTDARLDPAAIPVSAEASELAERDGRAALEHALTDGEDYELLFALDQRIDPAFFEAEWRGALGAPLTRIGVIAPAANAAPGQDRQILAAATGDHLLRPGARGYEHWR
jgi:thiamine-monophosphate kinase